jgi:hypothetical protein
MKTYTFLLILSAMIYFTPIKAQIAINQDGSDANASSILDVKNSAGTHVFYIEDASGEVGIGVTSPSALLDVGGTSEFNGTMNLTNDNITHVNALYINDIGDQEGIIWSGSAAKIFVSPLNSGNSDGYLRLINDGGIVFEPGSEDNEAMIIQANGRIGISTITPACPLQFINPGGVADTVWLMQWDNNHASRGAAARFQHSNSSNGNRVLMGATNYNGSTYAASAVIGISLNNTTSGTGGIGVYGSANNESGNAIEGHLHYSGSYSGWAGYFNANVYASAYYVPSDKKLKRNIKLLNNGINIIKQVNPVSFYYNTEKYPTAGFDENWLSYGFIAQELEQVLPKLVKEKNLIIYPEGAETVDISRKRETELIKVINYTEMIPILTQAIKEQQEIIEDLKQRLEELEAKVNKQ